MGRSRLTVAPGELIAAYAELGTYRAVADRYGISVTPVHHAVARTAHAPVSTIVRMHGRLGTHAAVAEKLGTSPSTVHRRLKAAGVTRRYTTAVTADEIAAAYAEGGTYEAVASRYGISVWTVHHRLKDLGVTKCATNLPLDTDTALQLRADGLTIAQIAERHGVSASTVKNRLAGRTFATPVAPSPEPVNPLAENPIRTERDAEWVDLIDAGLTFSEIARLYDVSRQRVSLWAKRRDIAAPPKYDDHARRRDLERVAEIARTAHNDGMSMSEAVSNELEVTANYARVLITRARHGGHRIPNDTDRWRQARQARSARQVA